MLVRHTLCFTEREFHSLRHIYLTFTAPQACQEFTLTRNAIAREMAEAVSILSETQQMPGLWATGRPSTGAQAAPAPSPHSCLSSRPALSFLQKRFPNCPGLPRGPSFLSFYSRESTPRFICSYIQSHLLLSMCPGGLRCFPALKADSSVISAGGLAHCWGR